MNDNYDNNQNAPGGTTLVPAQCPNCGGELTVDSSQEAAVCQFCGTPFIVSKAVQNYNVQHNTYQTNIVNERKGAVESILSYASERQDKKQQRLDEERRRAEEERLRREEKKKKRNHTILWVLGWIFIFPVPLTILVLRSKDMSPKLKYGIIAAGWIVYFLLFIFNGGRDRAPQTDPAPISDRSVTAEVPEEKPVRTTERKPEKPAATVPAQETKAAATEAPTEVQAEVDSSQVTPEFKATMDEYEAFYDQYIDFMNRYSSGEYDMNTMLNDYMDMLSKMDEWSAKIDAIDESQLSPADYQYYLEVTMRIEKKLLGTL